MQQYREMVLLGNDFIRISFDGGYDNGKYLFASSELYNGMVKMNKATQKVDYVCEFPHSNHEMLGQHHKVYKYKESLVFTPDNAKGIHVYNLLEGKMVYYAIDEQTATKTRCIDSFLKGNKLWLIYAYVEHPLVIVNLDTWQMERIEVVKELLPKEIIERSSPVFWSVFTCKGSCLYGVVWQTPYTVEIDTETREICVIKLQDAGRKLTTVVCSNNFLWCAERDCTEVTCWNRQGEFVEKYSLKENVQMHEKGNFSNLILLGEKIYMVTNMDNSVFYLDQEEKAIKVLVAFPEQFKTYEDVRKDWRRFFSYDILGDTIRLYPTNSNMMLDIDVNKAIIKGYQFVLENKYDEKWYKKTFIYSRIETNNPNKQLNETTEFTLRDYLSFISDK